jgi:transposase
VAPIISDETIEGISRLSEAKAVIRLQNEIIVRLDGEVRALGEEVARLSKNSQTSSKPPSSDIVKPPAERRQKGKRRRGAQKGHKETQRALVPPEEVDHFVEVEVAQCSWCGSKRIAPLPEKMTRTIQRFELVENPVSITEYHLHSGQCRCCKEVTQAAVPAGVVPDSPFGVGLQALMGYMKGRLGVSYTEIQEFMKDCLGLEVSTGAITNVVMRTSEAIRPSYEEVAQILPHQKTVGVDETSWSDEKIRYWLWVFCTTSIIFFSLARSRGAEVLRQILGADFGGGIISDFFSSYIAYGPAAHQFCLAHLIRDLKYCLTVPGRGNKHFAHRVLDYMKEMFKLWHEREQMTERQFKYRFGRVKRRLRAYLESSRPVHKESYNLKKRMLTHFDSLFRFATEPQHYHPTNNDAERSLRLSIRIRRQTQGTRSENGRRWIERSLTVVETCRLQGKSSFHFFKKSLNAFYFGSQRPSLLPN